MPRNLDSRLAATTPVAVLLAETETPAAATISAALALLGGRSIPLGAAAPIAVIADAAAVNDLPEDKARTLAELARKVPCLVFTEAAPADAATIVAEAFRRLTQVTLDLVPPRPTNTYRFEHDPLLWPFAGLTLSESGTRTLAGIAAGARRVEPLIASERGAVLVRCPIGAGAVFASLVPVGATETPRLKDGFSARRFAGVLPLLVFLRAALGTAAWRTPRLRAAFVIDDANLRRSGYGFLDYRALIAKSREHGFHTALAMIPLDFEKTRPEVARFVKANERHLSLVMHGVYHTRHEFGRPVAAADAERRLVEGLRRMEAHRAATGVGYARVMTFPFGLCSPDWMRAMRNIGFDAVVASRALPFRDEEGISERLYEMHPAEMSFHGLPVLNRYKAEEPEVELLFQGWLGKPIVVYTHHEFFRDGLDRLTEIADFISRHLDPEWRDLGTIVRGNFQRRIVDGELDVRVFSNRVSVLSDPGRRLGFIYKPGQGVPPDEVAELDGAAIECEVGDDGVVAMTSATPGSRPMEITFRPLPRAVSPGPSGRPPLRARARRALTELRDQSRSVAARR